MDEKAAYALLTEIFHEAFERDDLVLAPAMQAKDVVGWDSFKHVEIILAIEERLGVKFKSREIDQLQNVGDIIALILSKA